MFKLNQVATSVAAALALGYGASAFALPSPGAVAEGMFTMSSLRICNGDAGTTGGSAGACSLGFATFGSLTGSESAGATAQVNGVTDSDLTTTAVLGTNFSATAQVGAGFTPGVPIPAAPAVLGQYAGGTSSSAGFSLTGTGASVLLHSQTQLNSFDSDSSASSEQTLNATFQVTLLTTTTFELSFDGTKKLRAGLGQPNFSVDADTSLSFDVTDLLGGSYFSWSPDGSAGGISCALAVACTEYADGFNYGSGIGFVGFTADADPALLTGYFEAELTLAPGTYNFTINGQTQANATILPVLVPEPHTLALLGLGLLGLGVASRRKA